MTKRSKTRRIGSRGVVAATASTAAVVEEATQEDKARAAAVLGLVASDDLLVLNDKNFVIALWRRATGAEVRASAELAFFGSDGECTQWIKTGLQEANHRDQVKEVRDAEIARAARELKQRAAVTIQSNRDFMYALYQRATGPKVKAAALDCLRRVERRAGRISQQWHR